MESEHLLVSKKNPLCKFEKMFFPHVLKATNNPAIAEYRLSSHGMLNVANDKKKNAFFLIRYNGFYNNIGSKGDMVL